MHPFRPWPCLGILRLILIVLSLQCLVLGAFGALTNNTIDDVKGDSSTGAKVAYIPATGPIWNNQDECGGCAIVPDTTDAFDNTWTGVTYDSSMNTVSATFTFTGTAVYIYFILSNYPASSGLFSDVLCNFLLDGTNVGSYTHNTDGTKVFQYNVLVFSQTGLSNGLHTFVIQPANNFDLGNYVIFDYAKYTTGTDDTTSSSSTTTTISHTTSSSTATPTTDTQTVTVTPPPSSGSSSSTSSSAGSSSAGSSSGGTSASSTSTTAGQGTISSPSSSGSGSSSSESSSSSSSSSASSSSSSSTSLSDSQNQNLATGKKPVGAVAGGVVAGIIVVIIVLLALLCICRRRRRRVSAITPPVLPPEMFEDRPMSPPPAPLLVDHALASKRRAMGELEQRSHVPSSYSSSPPSSTSAASSGDALQAQVEMMRAQIQRLEVQQSTGHPSGGPVITSNGNGSGSVMYQHHADSGLRLNVNEAGQVIDIPPAYA